MFPRVITLALLLFKAISNGNAGEPAAKPPSPTTWESIVDDLNEAKELFKRNYELRHKVTIDDVHVELKPEVFKGSYFTSEIFQIAFSFMDRDKRISTSALLKVPKLGPKYQHGVTMLFYAKEKLMYEEVIPRLYENVPYEQLSPIFYGTTKSDVLILEDLRNAGYEAFPKGSLVGLAETEAVWKSLAEFHALSIRPLNGLSARIDSLTVMNRCQSQWLTDVFPSLAEKFKKHVLPQFSQGVNTFFDDFLIDFCPRWINPAYTPNKFGRNVVLHGDTHLSNILFKYEAGEIKCKFIDFQISRRGSAAIDLMFFTVKSVHSKIFDENRDRLFKLYIQAFNSTLKKIGIAQENFYTLDAFQTEWEKYREFYLFLLVSTGKHMTLSASDEGLIEAEDLMFSLSGWMRHFIPAEYN